MIKIQLRFLMRYHLHLAAIA
uniref:Uncharacterized protein n=1 Tax=Arundo donax TaxID=35708 RepID=A0A0A9C8R7_ARUDO